MARRQRARRSILTGLGLIGFALVAAACGGGPLLSGGGVVGGLLVVGVGLLLSFTATTQSGCVGPCLSPPEPDMMPCLSVLEPEVEPDVPPVEPDAPPGDGDGDGDGGTSDGGTALAPTADETRERLVERGVLNPGLAERLAHLDKNRPS